VVSFASADGTRLGYRQVGAGRPLICLPGGPMRSSGYLGDLGGLSAHRTLVLLDLRGTGESAVAADPDSYRIDRQVEDVEALRGHLGLDRLDLAGHSAGATLALLYALRYPDRVGRLVLITPSPRALGLTVTDADRRKVAELRRAEPWYPAAFAAYERIWSDRGTEADWEAIVPFAYGRWGALQQGLRAREASDKNEAAAHGYYAAGALDPDAVRSAVAHLPVPVLVVAGGYDVYLPPERAAGYAGLFPRAEFAVLPGAGHYPWFDDAELFTRTVSAFLTVADVQDP
jgi:pimeloyl-ACP methyl ester carboxylesterase